jgi:CHASE3 domain sensor protein
VGHSGRVTEAPRREPRLSRGSRPLSGSPILVAVSLLLGIVALAIGIAVYSIFSLSQDQSQLQDQNVPYAVAVATVALNAKGIANDERGYLISGDREFIEEIEQRLINVRTAFSEAGIAADGERQRRAIAEANAGFEEWFWVVRSEINMFQAGDREKATKTALGPGRALRKKYEAALAEAQEAGTTAIHLRRNSFASSRWLPILIAVLLVVFAVGIAVTLWLLRTLEGLAAPAEPSEPEARPVSYLDPPIDRSQRYLG